MELSLELEPSTADVGGAYAGGLVVGGVFQRGTKGVSQGFLSIFCLCCSFFFMFFPEINERLEVSEKTRLEKEQGLYVSSVIQKPRIENLTAWVKKETENM